MTSPQTVQQLLNKVNLKLTLPQQCLSLKIQENFDSYKVIQRTLSFINSKGNLDYRVFDCIHFENENAYCEIVPDCNLQTVLIYTRLKDSGRWVGCSFNSLGEVSIIS